MNADGNFPMNESVTSEQPDAATPSTLLDMIGASWMTKVIAVAAELGIADHLAGGSQTIADLAILTECHAASLRRLMRGLASLDLCVEAADGSYTLTPFGQLLCADADQAVAAWAMWWGKHHWPTWGNLLHSVKTGASARDLVTSQPGYAYIANDPHAASVFNRAMVEVTGQIAEQVVRAIDFSTATKVVDVGGGNGVLLATVLKAHPRIRGILFDLPHGLAGAAEALTKKGVIARAEIVAGSFFDALPGGADVYLLKSILHNWDDEKSAAILRSCRAAMPPHGTLALIERVMPARMTVTKTNQAIARADLNMLVGLGGRERAADEYAALFDAAGFKLKRVVPAALEFSVIEATPC